MEIKKNVRCSFLGFYLFCFLSFGATFSVAAQTTVASDKAFGNFMANVVGSGQTSVSFASGGQAVISSVSGNLAYESPASVNIAGKSLPITVKARPLATSLAGSFVKVLKAAPFIGTAWALGSAAKDIADILNTNDQITVTKSVDGQLQAMRFNKGSSTEFSAGNNKWFGTAQAAANQYISEQPNWSSGSYYSPVTAQCNGLVCSISGVDGTWGTKTYLTSITLATRDSTTATPSAMTEQELINHIASKSGWPTQTESILKSAIDQGFAPEIDSSTKSITGPATSSSPKTTTKTLSDGSTETTTEKSTYTYQGDTITVTNQSTVTNFNPVTNQTSTTSNTTVTNPDLPPQDQCDKYPDSASCAKLGEAPTPETLNKKTHNLDITPIAFTSGGACPSPLTFTAYGQSHEFTYVPLCDKLAYVKPLMMLLAAFAAAYILASSFKV